MQNSSEPSTLKIVAKISPDHLIKVQEQCRKLRAEKFNEDLHKPK